MQDKASPPKWWRYSHKPAQCAGFLAKNLVAKNHFRGEHATKKG
ncbi:MAG: hypothetical protein ACLTU3_13235 [Acutalibacteraceae bacterium]